MKRALILLAGCWSAKPPPPPPVVSAPPAPKYDELVKGTQLEPYTGEMLDNVSQQIEKPPSPWAKLQIGSIVEDNETTYALEIVLVGGNRYMHHLGGGNDGMQFELFRMADLVPGGALELLVQDVAINDGGQRLSLWACGIGPSDVPSCGESNWSEVMDLYQPSEFVLSTPREGGIVLTPKQVGKRRHIGFDFP